MPEVSGIVFRRPSSLPALRSARRSRHERQNGLETSWAIDAQQVPMS